MMNKTFKHYKNLIESIEPPYEREKEDVRLALSNILDDWKEERGKMIEAMKLAHDTLHPLNYDSYNSEMTRDDLKAIITKAEKEL